jgi:dolichyl-phosphate beta-glucosyltransferase
MELSIVIPAYEESHKIARDIEAAAAFFSLGQVEGELIVVDDGSRDDTSGAAAAAGKQYGAPLRVIRLDSNHGKGGAVRAGILESRGDFILFADSGYSVPFEWALTGIEMIQSGQCQIAHGSRKMPGCHIVRRQPALRRFLSKSFRRMVDLLLKVPHDLTDTQCGFKVYHADVAKDLYSELVTEGFTFDIEIILRAVRHGYRIAEFPIEWACDCDSRISIHHTSWRVLRELLRIRGILAREKR